MPKPRDALALREEVRSRAFTPAVRDVDGLALLLGDDDEDVARAAAQALGRAGAGAGAEAVATRLVRALKEATPKAKAQGLRVVGALAPKGQEAARALIAALSDDDARVERAAANALGRLADSEAREAIDAALLEAWDQVPELPLARALAEAMGKLGVLGAKERLETLDGGDRELVRIARQAETRLERDASRDEESSIDGDAPGDAPVDVVLLCRPGLEAMVAAELAERCPEASHVAHAHEGQVTARWQGAPARLFAVRTMLSFAFALPRVPLLDGETLPAACVRALSSDASRRIFTTWTRGKVRYRLDWRGEGHRRGATWKVVHGLSEREPGWINDPKGSTWQVSVSVRNSELSALLFPRKLPDPRFAYRVRDVPAASHPTLAAAIVRASSPTPDDVVWDPFVGSGSELIERARLGPYRALFGTDLDPAALEAARENLVSAKLEGVTLAEGDATTHSVPGVTRIVTNPPMGRRVARDGSLADLLDRFTDHAAAQLRRGGRVSWLSPLGARTAARAEERGFEVTLRQEVDMGGFHAELQVWVRK